ncbi:DUF1254 domain-containing protein [Croceicoccus sp. Ery15]|uniref:DUF1254 domain-containing protein n=1 Tax=Croceicoccus sp. Ery15 TaxID=1703338 RepID=UPI001E34D464|nr:DUF1254 domain-containing protein [Croceicoccus sp. Ery15]
MQSNNRLRRAVTATAILCLLIAAGTNAHAREDESMTTTLEQARLQGNETIETPIGAIELTHNYFDDDASARLFDEMDYQRAAQAYIWSTPMTSLTTWRDQQASVYGASDMDFVVYETLKEKIGVVTGNLTTPYIMNFTSLKDGPLEIAYPAGQTAGGILDFWQRPVFDLGLTGPDKGEGATYIVVGPSEDPAQYERDGAYVYQSATNNIFIGIRLLDTAAGALDAFGAAYKMGPVGQPLKDVGIIKGKDLAWSGTAARGLDYWKTLASVLQDEPVRDIDKPWMAMLAPLGIEPGQPFQPDARQAAILTKGAAMGELMARNLQVNPRYTEPYWTGTQWYKSFDFHIPQETETRQELDERATWFYEAIGSTEGMVNPTPGAGQVYMTTKRDSNGDMLRADRTYRLHVPANVPVAQFWSLTLYSENTRRPYENGGTEIRSTSLDSRDDQLAFNDDGSIDLFVGVKPPAGMECNFMKTVDQDGWFVYFRLYAPEQPFFDKSFRLPDFERID